MEGKKGERKGKEGLVYNGLFIIGLCICTFVGYYIIGIFRLGVWWVLFFLLFLVWGEWVLFVWVLGFVGLYFCLWV
jgi:hypothetical protein